MKVNIRFVNLGKVTAFSEIKSNLIVNFVSIKGKELNDRSGSKNGRNKASH